MALQKQKKMTAKELTEQVNHLTQTVITLHNTSMQIGRFITDYIDYKGDTADFQIHVDKLIAEEQARSQEGENDGEKK